MASAAVVYTANRRRAQEDQESAHENEVTGWSDLVMIAVIHGYQ